MSPSNSFGKGQTHEVTMCCLGKMSPDHWEWIQIVLIRTRIDTDSAYIVVQELTKEVKIRKKKFGKFRKRQM